MAETDVVPQQPPPAEGKTWVDQALGGENPDDQIAVVSPSGRAGTVRRADLDEAVGKGFKLEHPEATHERDLEREYGDAPVRTAFESAASTATFGLSDMVGGEPMRERRKRNEGAAIVGGVAGAFVPWGAGSLASGAGRAAEGLVGRAVGKGIGGRLASAGAKGAAEGALFGAGAGVSEVALSKDPVTWESAAATIGSNALGGAVFGGGIGVGAKLLEEGAVAAGRYAAKKVAAASAPEAAAVDRSAFPEIAGLDKKAAREAIAAEREGVRAQRATDLVEGKAAREAEVAALEKSKDAATAELHKDALAYKDFLRNERSAFIETADAETASILKRSKVQIMKGLDNAEGFIKKRGAEAVIDGLQKQKGALQNVLADVDTVVAGAGAERQAMLDALPRPGKWTEGTKELYLNPQQSKLYAEYAGITLPKGQASLSVYEGELAGFREAIERGDINPPNLQRVLNAQQLLERNQALLDHFAAVRAPVASDALASIDARLEAARAGVAKTPKLEALEAHLNDLVEETLGKKIARGAGGLAGGSAGFAVAGPLGAAAGGLAGQEIGARLFDKLIRKIQTGNAMRAKSIAGSVATLFAKGAEKGARAAKRVAPLASKIVPAIQYAQRDYVDGVLGPAHERESKNALVNHFRERARELNALTEKRPDGTYDVRMGAREILNARLQALWAVDPDAANGVEKTHNARISFLAGKLPRDPSPPHLQAGPDTWEPSHAELAKFGRYMDAVEHPENVVQRMSTATMTPEDAEVLKSVYPLMYEQIQGQIYQNLAELRTTLPYAKRLALSIYLDVPVDSALTPEALSVYQRPAQPSQPAGARPQGPATQMPTGQVEPTRAQRFSS